LPKKDKFDKIQGKLKIKFYRINQRIQANKVRVVDDQGKQVGVITLSEALKLAQNKKLDLVEVAPSAKPPVCKIIDFKRFKFLEAKKIKDEKKKSKKSTIKEIRLTPFIAERDLSFRIKEAKQFLKLGNQVKLVVFFRGRQITKKDFGYNILKKALIQLGDKAEATNEPKWMGRKLEVSLKPIKIKKTQEKKELKEKKEKKNEKQKKQKDKTKNQKVS